MPPPAAPAVETETLIALLGEQRYAEGATLARSLLQEQPDDGLLCHLLGVCLLAQGLADEALPLLQQATAHLPDDAELHCRVASACRKTGRLPEAVSSYQRAIALQPENVETHISLGNCLKAQNRLPEALNCYRRAVKLQASHAGAHYNLASGLAETACFSEAETHFRAALTLRPDYYQAHGNLANTLQQQGRYAEAESAYRRAIEIRADYPEACNNLAMLLLSLGRYAEGWPLYEARHHPHKLRRSAVPPESPSPCWRGESLAGKSLLLWPEQGFGDEIQFARYAPLLKARGLTHLTLVCKAPLKALLATLDGVDTVITANEALPPHNFWSFPLSLPLLLGTTLQRIPATLPYLHADPQRLALWRPRLPASGRRIGLVWQGNSAHGNDAHRSLPGLASLAPLWSVPDLHFISLQKGRGELEAATPPVGQDILALGQDIGDFADSAAIVAQLDLVICVDTAIAHLAGALGIPCWVLLPAVGCDWRWLHARSDSPWYPGVLRLFRQKVAGDWQSTVAQVAQALQKRSAGNDYGIAP